MLTWALLNIFDFDFENSVTSEGYCSSLNKHLVVFPSTCTGQFECGKQIGDVTVAKLILRAKVLHKVSVNILW